MFSKHKIILYKVIIFQKKTVNMVDDFYWLAYVSLTHARGIREVNP